MAQILSASISKLFCGVAILQLYEDGLLDLNADINKYLPSDISIRNPHFPSVNITAFKLLRHKAGLVDSEIRLQTRRTYETDFPCTLKEEIKDHLFQNDYDWTESHPNSKNSEWKYYYSNAGFTLLGYLIECVSKKSFADFIRERIFEPLGIKEAYWFIKDIKQFANVAVPHNAKKCIGHFGVAEYPAAQLRITLNELSKFLMCFTDASKKKKVKLFKKKKTLEMMCPRDIKDGLAWWGKDAMYAIPEREVWNHGGFVSGTRTHIYYFPNENLGIIILTNSEHDYKQVFCELIKFADIYCSK